MSKWTTTSELRKNLNAIDRMLFPLLRWVLTSARAHLARIKPDSVRYRRNRSQQIASRSQHPTPLTSSALTLFRGCLRPRQSTSTSCCPLLQRKRESSNRQRSNTAHSGPSTDRATFCLRHQHPQHSTHLSTYHDSHAIAHELREARRVLINQCLW